MASFFNLFLLTPLREGRLRLARNTPRPSTYFYSRPCGRGDIPAAVHALREQRIFLLTPLREGRLLAACGISLVIAFLLTPLREGRLWD